MTPITHDYDIELQWQEGRIGIISTKDSPDTLRVATPPEFPAGVKDIWSPEHLFTAAVNSCLMTTFLAIADNSNFQFVSFSSSASGKLEMVNGKYAMSQITLQPLLRIEHQAQEERALRILQKAGANCLISNSITSTIISEPTISVISSDPK
jgi:organic hydroperoxide reductase OsmC/OhrA